MDRTELAFAVAKVSRLRGEYRLRSGVVVTEYFDKYRFEADPALLRAITDSLVNLVPPATDALAGLELGGVPLATALSFGLVSLRSSSASGPRSTEPVALPRVGTSLGDDSL